MSTDSQFTATGPAAIGFQTQSLGVNTIGIGLDVSGVYTGVKGTGTQGQVIPPTPGSAGIGVQGNGSGVGWGVAGYGGDATKGTTDADPTASAGVRGEGGQGPQAGGPGVFGLGGKGGGVGVFGQGSAPALGSTEPGGPGVKGIGGGNPKKDNADGVQGFGVGAFTGVVGWGDPNANGSGVVGFGGTVNSATNAGGPGVRGIGAGAPNVMPPPLPDGFPNPVGVFGVGGGSSDPNFGSPINGAGVIGIGGSSTKPNGVGNDADGVQGFGVGAFSGVAGFGGENSGTGVFGLGGGPSGPGVRGILAGAPNEGPSLPAGVFGRGRDDVISVGVQGTGYYGVWAKGQNLALFADGTSTLNGEADVTGNLYVAQGVIVHTNLEVTGDLYVFGGTKSVVVPFPDGSHRQLYCMESPESWFEDFGSGHLTNGRAQIQLDPDFAATVRTDDYHVFIAEYDDNNALFVTNRTKAGFEVRAKTSTSVAKFSYRVVARRKDIAAARLAKVTLPKAREEAALARLKSARA